MLSGRGERLFAHLQLAQHVALVAFFAWGLGQSQYPAQIQGTQFGIDLFHLVSRALLPEIIASISG